MAAYYLFRFSERCFVKLENFCDDGNFDTPTYVPVKNSILDSWKDIMNKYLGSNPEEELIVISSNLIPGGSYTFPSISKREYDSYTNDLGRLFNCI